MGKERYLLDSNVVIDYLGGKIHESGMNFLNPIIDEVPNISVITKIEVLGFKASKKTDKLLTDFIKDSSVIHLSDEIIDSCIKLRKSIRIRLPDAIIASTAIVHNLQLITRNTKDFTSINKLKIIDPHKKR